MRAALAGQKYDVQKKAKAYELIAGAMNLGSPDAAQAALQNPNAMIGIGSKFTPELYFAISRYDPKIAETVKNAASMDIERFKAMNEMMKTNIDITKMYQQFGKPAVDYFMSMNGGRMPNAQPAPSAAPNNRPPAAAGSTDTTQTTPDADNPNLVRNEKGEVVDVLAQPDPDAEKPITIQGQQINRPAAGTSTTPSSAPVSEGAQFGIQQISPNKYKLQYSGRVITFPEGTAPDRINEALQRALTAEEDIYKKTVEAESKPFEEKVASLLQFDNQATAVNLDRVAKILKIVRNNPKITGVLQQTDNASGLGKYMMALGAAAQEGIQAGKFGQFSLPIEKFINTANLSQEQKAALGELSRLISQEFLAGMRANRGLLGVNPTDNDARLFQAAAESPTSLVDNIYSWAQGRAAEYMSMNDIYKGYSQFRTKRGRGFDPASFFMDESSPYHAGVKSYTERLMKIRENTPGVQ
jgi:hypothetical protein